MFPFCTISGGIIKGIVTNMHILFLYEMLPCCASLCENYESDNISGKRASASETTPLGKIEKIVDRM